MGRIVTKSAGRSCILLIPKSRFLPVAHGCDPIRNGWREANDRPGGARELTSAIHCGDELDVVRNGQERVRDGVEYLADRGFDHNYGARQLQRTIEPLQVIPLARYLVTNPNLKAMTIKTDLSRDRNVVFCTDSSVTKNGMC